MENPPQECTNILSFLCVPFFLSPPRRSLPKLSSQDEEGGAAHGFGGGVTHFEPIPHDHDFCERVVINVSIERLILENSSLTLSLSSHLPPFNPFPDAFLFLNFALIWSIHLVRSGG